MKFYQNKSFQLYAGGTLLGITLILLLRKMINKDYSNTKWWNNTRTRKYYDRLHPKFKPKVAEWFTKVEKSGLDVYPTSGYRSFEEQINLYNQNSSNAKPGYSYHNFGLAIDVNIMRNGVIIAKKSDSCQHWKNTGVVQLALDSGIRWKCDFGTYHDPVHFDLVFPGLNTTILRERVNAGKVDKNGYVLI
jgi:hypothetical protein